MQPDPAFPHVLYERHVQAMLELTWSVVAELESMHWLLAQTQPAIGPQVWQV
jgi:hypothetical protein